MTCSVCNRAGSDVTERPSSLTQNTVCYCLDCLISGREPYEDLVNYGFTADMFSPSYQQKVILPTLLFNNKTVEQFNEDVLSKFEDNT